MRGVIAGVVSAVFVLPAAAGAAEPYFDVRDHARPSVAPADTRAFERRAGAAVDLDPSTGTPRVVAKPDGTLTGAAGGTAASIGLEYVRDHLAEFGLTAADLDTLEAPTVATVDGIRQVRWRQAVDGVRAADAELRVNVTADGRVLSVLGSPAHDLPTDTTPDLTAGEAVRAVQDDVGVYRTLRKRSGVRRVAFDDGTTAKLALYNGALTWRVTYRAGSDAVYDSMVDATSGKVLRRANLVKSVDGLVWENHPTSVPGFGAEPVSLDPWLTSATTLEGPWVKAFVDVNDNDTADDGEDVIPGSYTFTPYPGSGCDVLPCSWDGSSATALTNKKQNAVQAFYLANRFHDHLAADPIGFDGFEGADKVVVNTTDGGGTSGHTNNANMYTPPDGSSPIMQMYLWTGAYRSMNGGDDASILFHEYTHGLTNRLVTDADGAGALNSAQAGAMGEGWSDFYAKDYLVSEGLTPDTAAPGEVSMGEYTDRPGTHVIRNQALDCPVGAAAAQCPGGGNAGSGGFTYGDFGKVEYTPEVHGDGEIWAETLWDLRDDLGSADALRLVTAALKLSPPEPSFLEMRNAILQADAGSGGTFRNRIWAVFAKRGMGFYASSTDGNDVKPLEDFSLPPAANGPRGTIAGTVTDPNTGLAIEGATIGIGGNSSGPDMLATTSDAAGHYSLRVPPGTYANVVARKAGYERALTSRTVAADQTVVFDPELRRDWAARDGGAILRSTAGGEYTSYGCGPGAAIDNSQSTAWSTDYKSGTEKPLVVELPKTINVSQFAIDPAAGCGDSVAASLRDYIVETSPTGVDGSWTRAAAGTFTSGNGAMNLVNATGGATGVRFVKLRPLTPRNSSASFLDVSEFAVYEQAAIPAPETTITSGPSGPDSNSAPTFTFSSNQARATFQCKLDAGSYVSCASPYTISVADGPHTLLVRAVNVNGVVDDTPESRTWTTNTTLPGATLTESPPDYTGSTVTFRFTLSPNATSATCAFDGITSDCSDGTFERRGLAQGSHTFTVTAHNAVGDDPSPPARTFTVDTVAPDPRITGATVVDDAVTFAFTAVDASPVTFTCTFNGVTAACGSPKTYSALANGTYTLHLVVTDKAGNVGSADRTVTIAAAAYDVSFTSTPAAIVSDRDVEFEFASSAPGARFECSLDGAVYTPCDSPWWLTGVAEGAHTFAVRAVGPGTRRSTPARFDFTVDRTAPITSITLAPPPILTSRTFSLGFIANEPARFVCNLDGVDHDCASPWAMPVLADGPHHVVVTAIDAAGNADPFPAVADFTVSVPAVSATPTPTPSTTPAPPKAKALTRVTIARTASLKTLKKQKKLKVSVHAASGAKVSVEAKLGSRPLAKASRNGTGAITLKLSSSAMRRLKKNATLTVRFTASGANLTPVTHTAKVKLKT